MLTRHALRFAVALSLAASVSAVQAQVIRFKNVGGGAGHEIPLKANSSVDIDASGNLVAECALNAAGQCPALVTGPSGGAPVATLSRTDSDASLVAGESVQLAWTSNGNACEASVTSPAATGFTGVRPASSPSGETVTLPMQGTYTFSLTCYNAAGASAASTVTASVAAGPGPSVPVPVPQPADCTVVTSDPAFNPGNFARVDKTWTQAFSAPDGDPQVVYPSGYGFTSIVGANKGTYVVVPFVANAGETINLYWDQVQAQPNQGYPLSRPADGMFFAISPCKGDVRAPAYGNADPFLRGGCRKWSNSASLVWSTQLASSDESGCKVTAGKTYFLHVMAADPSGGLVTGEHSCADVGASSLGCDVQVKLSQ